MPKGKILMGKKTPKPDGREKKPVPSGPKQFERNPGDRKRALPIPVSRARNADPVREETLSNPDKQPLPMPRPKPGDRQKRPLPMPRPIPGRKKRALPMPKPMPDGKKRPLPMPKGKPGKPAPKKRLGDR